MTKQITPIAFTDVSTDQPATPSTRPIIVTNRPIMQDPMMVTAGDTNADGLVDTVAKAGQPSAYAKPKPVIKPTATPTAAPALVVEPAPKPKPAEPEAISPQEVTSLVAEKTYFLPINAVAGRRSRAVVIAGLIVIVALSLLWLDISLDAGFVRIPGVKPLTNFFGAVL